MRRGRDAHGRAGRHAAWFRVTAAASSATLLGTLGLAGTSMAATGAAAKAAKPAAAAGTTSCHLGNGVKHVVNIVFDNVHYFRDNPNVPSDLKLLPNLLNFIEHNGTMLTNNHTPLIAHTANDILTNFTGLYGDRHGMPISNSYQAYNADGSNGTFNTTNPAGSFAYWTDPVFDTKAPPSAGHDTNPSMVYAPVPPATASRMWMLAVAPDVRVPITAIWSAAVFVICSPVSSMVISGLRRSDTADRSANSPSTWLRMSRLWPTAIVSTLAPLVLSSM